MAEPTLAGLAPGPSDLARARDGIAAADVRFRELVEVASDAIYTLDRAGVLTSVNAAMLELAGRGRDDLLGRSLLPLLEPADQPRMEAILRAVGNGARRRLECRVSRADGEWRLVSVSHTPLRNGHEVVGVLAVARDVTEERARAAALERAEARYTRLVETAEDGIATMDEEGHLTSVNRALERVTGRRREALIGTHFADLVEPAEREPSWRMFVATLGGARQRREMRFVRADGRPGIATVLSAPVLERGRITGVLVVARDVTEERMLFDRVVRREKLAALGELVGGVAHEINTPLTGILAFAQLLVAQGGPPDTRQAAETIAHEAKRAARIVRNLLTFARQNPPERLATDLNQVLQDTLELRRHPLNAQGITLGLELDPQLPRTHADPFQLQQVFLNLLANAEQAVTAGDAERRITVRTRRDGDLLIVAIADSGAGIAPEHLPHIFNPFYTTKPRGIGTGLGLSISDGIVREHAGVLRVQSEPGAGAVFEVCLPLVSPPQRSPV
jgi:two-component system, NtrC family, sensor kinase